MKKLSIFLVVCLALASLALPFAGLAYGEPPPQLYLPEGEAVYDIFTPNGTSVNAIQSFELTYGSTYAHYANLIATDYPDILAQNGVLRDPDVNYNCFSYAFYSQNDSNNVNILFPDVYVLDGSYAEVVGAWEVGDIVLYFGGNDYVTHAAVIESVQPGNPVTNLQKLALVTVISKWGTGGLYKHRGNYCPYAPTFNDGDYDAETVYRRAPKAYRLHPGHIHESGVSGSGAGSSHLNPCFCGHREPGHILNYYSGLPNPAYHTLICRDCGYSKIEGHRFVGYVVYSCACGYSTTKPGDLYDDHIVHQ